MISARGLTRKYRDGDGSELTVLDDVSLEIAAGEFVAVMGRSGSGKSTLLHILGGLDTDYRGQVSVAGVALTGQSDQQLSQFRNQKVAFVFQSFHLVPGLSALDNVALPSFFAHGPVGDVTARATEALTRVGMAAKAERQPHQLSGGERQRIAIARALFTRPQVLLCDEPTGNLDAATGAEVIALFETLHREGLTVLAVTHEERVSHAAQRVLRLEKGKLS